MSYFTDRGGVLQGKFAVGNGDKLHLSPDGLKVYSSRFKFALRARHGLPNTRRPRTTNNQAEGHRNSGRGRGGRGGNGGRGGRTG